MNIKKTLCKKTLLGILALICIAIIAGFCFFMPDVLGQFIKRFGVKLTPQTEIEPLSETVYLQNDDRWKDEYLAETSYTLGSQGCLTCVVAMDLCYLGYDVIPTDVNEAFIESDAYTQNGELIWYKINSAYDDIEYDYKKLFNSRTISNDLENGILPIVKVRYKKTGIFHWVLIVGADEEDFLILDPLEKSKKPIHLGEHGRVYAYRVIKKIN